MTTQHIQTTEAKTDAALPSLGNATKGTNHNPKPWVIVENPGTDCEDVHSDYKTFREAIKALDAYFYDEDGAQIMRRNDDGTLTTEY